MGGDEGADARQCRSVRGVDDQHLGMRVRASQHRAVQHTGQFKVCRVAGLAGQFLPQVAADNARADNVQRHR